MADRGRMPLLHLRISQALLDEIARPGAGRPAAPRTSGAAPSPSKTCCGW